MRSGINIVVTASDRARRETLVAARGSPQKHVWRARIDLLTADGLGTVAIMTATGKSKTCVWRWQERFMAEGVEGLLRDRTRPAGIAPLAPSLVDRVVALTLEPPRHDATHWTVRAMVKAAGIAASSVVKIWHDHGFPRRQASTVFSKWFGRLMDRADLPDPALVFHSFRHNAEDAFRNVGQQSYLIDKIIGHADGSVSAAYGEGVDLEVAHAAVMAMKLKVRLPVILASSRL